MSDGAGSDVPAAVWKVLRQEGLLLITDRTLPNVAALIAKAPIHGSWWGHPKGQEIYRACLALDEHPDVLSVKLVQHKLTLVHRRIWADLLAMAMSGDAWQRRGLTTGARELLLRVETNGEVRSDEMPGGAKKAGALGRELEDRLLIHTTSIHTASGKHVKLLRSWPRALKGRRPPRKRPKPALARSRFEAWGARFGVQVAWPWGKADRPRLA
jgi:hypothetical protein